MKRNLVIAERMVDKASQAGEKGEAGAALDYTLAAIQALINHLDEQEGSK